MLDFNLLPPHQRLNLAYDMKSRAVITLGAWLIAIVLIFMALLLPTIFLLEFQKTEALRALEFETKDQEHAGIARDAARLKEINALAGAVVNYEKGRLALAPIIEGILRDVPGAIRFDSLQFRSSSREITMTGFSPTRAVFLDFLHALENDPQIASVSSPVANLISETDIRFTVTAIVKSPQ